MLTPNILLQGRYRVIRQLGRGGMGAVYEAIDQRLSCIVALKETLAETDVMRRAFEREASLLANLRHPALPKVIDHFTEGNGQFLVMEFIPGSDLAQLLGLRARPFEVSEVLRWAEELLKALKHLHSREPPIIHRDIKPANLKLTAEGEIILLDFGLAKGTAGQMSMLNTSRSVVGYTPIYAPLEQIVGTGTDSRSDIYSLGATVYHLITARQPVDSATRFAALEEDNPDPLRLAHELNAEVPLQVSLVLSKAMTVSRKQRLGSADEMLRLLRQASQALPSISEAPTLGVPPPTIASLPPTDGPQERSGASGDPHAAGQQPSANSEAERQRQLEEERQRQWDEDEARRRAAEDKRRREEEERLIQEQLERLKEEERRRRVAKEEAARGALEEQKRHEAEQQKLREAETQRRKLEEEEAARRRAAAEQEAARRRAEEEKRKREEEAARRRAEDERRRKEEERRRVEAEAQQPPQTVPAPMRHDLVSTMVSNSQPALWSEPRVEDKSMPGGGGGGSRSTAVLIAIGAVAVLVLSVIAGFWWNLSRTKTTSDNTAPKNTNTVATPSAPSISGSPLGVMNVPGELYEVALSADGQNLVSTARDGAARLWRTSDRKEAGQFTATAQASRSIAFSPNGQTVATGSDSDDGLIRLWRVSDRSIMATLKGHTGYVFSVVFSRDGQSLASASGDRTIRIWRLSSGESSTPYQTPNPKDLIVTISPDLKRVALYNPEAKQMKVWSLEENKITRAQSNVGEITCGAFSADGQMLAFGSSDGTLRVWRISDDTIMSTLRGVKGNVGSAAFSADGQLIAGGWNDGKVLLGRVSDGNVLKVLDGHKKIVQSLSFSGDGRFLASGSDDKSIWLWQIMNK